MVYLQDGRRRRRDRGTSHELSAEHTELSLTHQTHSGSVGIQSNQGRWLERRQGDESEGSLAAANRTALPAGSDGSRGSGPSKHPPAGARRSPMRTVIRDRESTIIRHWFKRRSLSRRVSLRWDRVAPISTEKREKKQGLLATSTAQYTGNERRPFPRESPAAHCRIDRFTRSVPVYSRISGIRC